MYVVHAAVVIPAHEVWFEFSHAAGPGGQNVNKVATRATLCFAVDASGVLDPFQKRRIRLALAARIGRDGVLRVACGTERAQSLNRVRAGERFCALLRLALAPRVPRVATRPSRASVTRRRDAKRRIAQRKRARQKPGAEGFDDA